MKPTFHRRTRNVLLIGILFISDWIRLKEKLGNLSIFSTYVPIYDDPITAKDEFCLELQNLSSSVVARDYLIIPGVFNARIGLTDIPIQVTGLFRLGNTC